MTVGSQSPLSATSDSNGAWSVMVPADAAYITGTSVGVSVSASKAGFTPPNDVTRTLAVDLAAPSVSYTTPSGLQVEVAIGAMSPTTSDTDIASYSATGLPSGLTIGSATGVISGAPDTANASTQQAMVTVSDSADNTATTSITFPTVAKGDQTLTEFRYSAETVTFGSPAPTVTAPGGVRTTVTYTATPSNVCTVSESTGVLTLAGVGACVITATAASSNNYNEATVMFTVTVQTQGPLALNLNTVAGDDTVNIAEKTAGFTISGDTGTENGVSVSVTVGSTTLQTTSGSNGAWSVSVPPAASYITGTSVTVTVSASKTGFTPPSDVTRSLGVDLVEPSVSWTAPGSLQVGVAIGAMSPTTSDTDIASYSATGLPSGLGLDTATGVISGTPDTANASTQQAMVTVSDSADNTATTLITFPTVAKGDQTLTGFRYSAETVTFGSLAPTVTAPGGVRTTVTYTATPSNVCTVSESTGALTLLGVGSCVVTATAASSNNYNEATAMFTVTVQTQGPLALNLNTVAGDDTVNIAEKTAGFTITGDTGSENGVSVSVTVGSTTLQTTSGSNGAWSVSVPPAASYITGTSVTVTVSASKTGFTAPNDVTRTLAVDLAAPSVSWTAPGSLQVGVAISAMSPTTSDTDIASYSATGLPSGLGLNTATGVISGTPNSANAGTQQATVTVSDSADNTATTSITFPTVAKGDQTLTGFRYSAETVTFGSLAPTVTAPGGVRTTVTYTATPSNVCTVNTSTGALTLLGVGACVITATAASSNNYNEATDMFTVTMLAQGTLALNLNTVAGDDTVNIAEKMAGFTITGDTGTENGVSVSVTIGSQSPLTATSGSNGAWSVSVPPDASYITGTSVAVTVSASKTGFTAPNNVTRTLAVDLAAPSVSYTAPSSLQVGVAITAMSPTTSDTDIASYSATGLPSGLVINAMTGAISGTPNSANAGTQQATVTVSDSADNTATTLITFPTVAKGDQTLTGFRYSAETVTFGSLAPTVTAPGGVRTTVTYTATPSNVCTVDTSTGALTLLGVGACVITATAASNNNYNEATATFTVTMLAQGTLALNLNTVAGDDTVNIAEKTAGFTITGDTGTENGVSVSVTIGSQSPLIATSDSNGAWSVSVFPDASYITGTSVAVTVSASKTGFTAPNDVTRTLAVDLAAPSVSWTAPGSLQVGVAISAMNPTTSDTDITSYSATGLPSGLSINTATGVISGTPDSANASTQQATVTVTDSAANTATTSITFPAVGEGDQTSSPDTENPDTENPDTEETEDEAHPDEREALLALYHATGGENWEYRDKWNTDEPVATWHGVTVDSEGRVTELDLAANGLSGEVPPSLVVNLQRLRRLYLNDNRLSAVPLAQLRDLLEGPDPALEELALWGNDLPGGTGNISVELDRRVERAALRALYEGSGGPRWKDSDSWLDETDPFSFSEWYGVIMTDDDGRVVELDLSDNGLSGELGGELESLGALYSLDLSRNPDLSGELPRGLMELSELEVVNIEDTGMCAPGDTEFSQWLEDISSFDGEICAEDWDDPPDTDVGTEEHDAGGGGGGCAVASGGSGVPFNLLLLIVALVLKLAAPARLPQLGAVGLR